MAVVRGVTLIVSNFEVTVEKLVYGGGGLARLDGRVVFAPFVLPGEGILARAERENPRAGGARGRPGPGSGAMSGLRALRRLPLSARAVRLPTGRQAGDSGGSLV